jgi:hypothetical protein
MQFFGSSQRRTADPLPPVPSPIIFVGHSIAY